MKNRMITFPLRMKGTFSFMSPSSHRTIINNMCFAKLSTCIKCDIFLHICALVFILHVESLCIIILCCILKSIFVLVFHFT